MIQINRQSRCVIDPMAFPCPSRGTSRRYATSKMLPLSLTAALAAWLRILRMWRLPVGQRVLLFIPALSSSPGHAPTHEDRFFGRSKSRRCDTYFGDDLLCRIRSQTRHLRKSLYCVLMLLEQARHLLVQLPDLVIDQLQLL